MQRREAKIGLRDRKCLQRRKERNDTNEISTETAYSESALGFAVWVGLGGGAGSRIRTGLPCEFPANSEFYRENCDFGVWKPAP